jgi:hypothetical protein
MNSLVQSSLSLSNSPHGENVYFADLYKFSINGDVTQSHYGPHDWIADEALRLLYDYDGADDWGWLLHNPSDTNPEWEVNYGTNLGTGSATHYPVRSYITYLYATQTPDIKPKTLRDKSFYDRYFIFDEGIIIPTRVNNYNWMGTTDYHSYIMLPWTSGSPPNERADFFIPQLDSKSMGLINLAQGFGNLAIDSLARLDRDGRVTVTRPETGAFYLGAMTHYLTDLATPPHLFQSGWYFTTPKAFHKWFESNSQKNFYWGTPGPHKGFIDGNLALIGKSSSDIQPIAPQIAATFLAEENAKIAFSYPNEDGGLLFGADSQRFGTPLTELDMQLVNWDDRHSNSLIGGIAGGTTEEEYYNWFEKCVNWAVYYTACALKWIKNEVDKRGGMNENDAAISYSPLRTYPVPNPVDSTDSPGDPTEDYMNLGIYDSVGSVFAILGPILAFVGVPFIIKKTVITKNH